MIKFGGGFGAVYDWAELQWITGLRKRDLEGMGVSAPAGFEELVEAWRKAVFRAAGKETWLAELLTENRIARDGVKPYLLFPLPARDEMDLEEMRSADRVICIRPDQCKGRLQLFGIPAGEILGLHRKGMAEDEIAARLKLHGMHVRLLVNAYGG